MRLRKLKEFSTTFKKHPIILADGQARLARWPCAVTLNGLYEGAEAWEEAFALQSGLGFDNEVLSFGTVSSEKQGRSGRKQP